MTDPTPGYQRFFAELKRRRVFRVMAVYGIVGFVLLQIVDLAVPALLLPEWTYRLVALILLLGFPVAVVIAWALELTPEGVRRMAEAAPGELAEIIAAPASKRWPAGVLALVGMTALLAGAWYVGRQSAPGVAADLATGPVTASIAVLPFVNMSDDASNEYFSDGISEELLNLLAKIAELRVAARTSSFSFKDQDLEITEIADRLPGAALPTHPPAAAKQQHDTGKGQEACRPTLRGRGRDDFRQLAGGGHRRPPHALGRQLQRPRDHDRDREADQ